MKVTNNLNMDLKEEIESLTNELIKLKIFKDDIDDNLIKEREKLMQGI